MTAPDSPVLLTHEAARFVKLGINAFRAAVKRGEIAQIVDEGHPRYLTDDLAAYLARKRQPATIEADEVAQRRQARPIDMRGLGPINRVTLQEWSS